MTAKIECTAQTTTEGLSRRDLILAGGVALLTTSSVSACGWFSTESDQNGNNGQTGTNGTKAKEAPTLAQLVEAGELPSLEERLPQTPLVIEPIDRIGIYSGQGRIALGSVSTGTTLYRYIGYEQLLSWDRDYVEPVPNLAESVEATDDGKEYMIHLRPGVKWSDGTPFTADDIIFAYTDVLNNPDLSPGGPPPYLVAGGEPAMLEKVDEATVRVRFVEPNGLFRHQLATPSAQGITTLPRHYLEQFHAEYNSNADSLAEAEGYADWVEMFTNKADIWQNRYQDVDHPTLWAWRLVGPMGEGDRAAFERNPYYWKTDSEGHQLPYLDEMVFELIENHEVILLRVANGEFDLEVREVNTHANKPVLANGREGGDYHFIDLIDTRSSALMVALNLTHQDPVKREIFSNRDFRIGLSYAINREELITAVFQGQGEPAQVAPLSESPFFDEELATQYTQFDVDLANQHLDQAGYRDRDSDGFRLGPDGNRISFDLIVTSQSAGLLVEGIELVRRYWQDVGIDIRVQTVDRTLQLERIRANEHDGNVQDAAGGMTEIFFQPQWFIPLTNHAPGYGTPWANWYLGAQGPQEEPPPAIRDQMEIWDRMTRAVDEEERAELLQQVLAIAKEQFYTIGLVRPARAYGAVKNNFHNVVDPMINGWQFVNPGSTNPEQYFRES